MMGGGIREISCGFVGDILSVKLPQFALLNYPCSRLKYSSITYSSILFSHIIGVLWYNSSNTISYTIANNLRVEITLTIYMAYMCVIVSDYFYSRDY